MSRAATGVALVCACLVGSPAPAAIVTESIVGEVLAVSGSGADVGAGEVTGFFEYDDAAGRAGVIGELFDLVDFELTFSNGPTITDVSPELVFTPVEIEVDPASGDLVAVSLLAFGLAAFGLDPTFEPVDLQFDGFSTTFDFFDLLASPVAAGSIRFVGDAVPAPEPTSVAALALGLAIAGIARRRRRSS